MLVGVGHMGGLVPCVHNLQWHVSGTMQALGMWWYWVCGSIQHVVLRAIT
jgi:hypothetical protein